MKHCSLSPFRMMRHLAFLLTVLAFQDLTAQIPGAVNLAFGRSEDISLMDVKWDQADESAWKQKHEDRLDLFAVDVDIPEHAIPVENGGGFQFNIPHGASGSTLPISRRGTISREAHDVQCLHR